MASSSDVLAKRPHTELNTRTALLSNSKQTKTALVQTLTQLTEHGLSDIDVTRGDLQKAAAYHSTQDTPYGTVVQRVEIDTSSKVPGHRTPIRSTSLLVNDISTFRVVDV